MKGNVHQPAPYVHSFAEGSFEGLIYRYAEPFVVRDIMVPLHEISYVGPGELDRAQEFVTEKRFSVVPVSGDGITFPFVFETKHPHPGTRIITEERQTRIADYIPDSTPLVEALVLFAEREWYLTLRGNEVNGLITYWAFNSPEFCVQLYAVFRQLEDFSRDALGKDGCGVSGSHGLVLKDDVIAKVAERFENSQKELGGNRFVDELDFHNVHEALKKHRPWRDFLNQCLNECLSDTGYDKRYSVTKLRDAVMHGRVVFPTYRRFKEGVRAIRNIAELIKHLDTYRRPPQTGASSSIRGE